MTIFSPLSLALPGSQAGRQLHGPPASAEGLLVVLAAVTLTRRALLDRGIVTFAAAVFGSRNCP